YKATLTGYSTTASYDVRLRVVDDLGTTTVNLNSLGTESVPLDVTQRGIAVGKIHSGSGANLQVGSGGISSEGPLTGSGFNALNHTRYNDKSNYLGAGYISGGNEKPNWFGPGKLKPQMLHARNFSGAPGGWHDALWISSYTGNDVKGSNVLLLDKSANRIGYARQNFDSTTWGKYVKIWDSTNDGSGSGLDADLLDGKHASTIINEAINGVTVPKPFTKGSNTNGKWIKFSDGTIIAERKVTVTYTHNQKIPNFAYNMPVSMPTDSYVGVSLRSVYTANSEAEIDIYDNFDFLVVGKRGNQWIMKPNLFNRYGSVSYGANNGNW